MTAPISVLHVTTGMGEGGAEAMLARVIAYSNARRLTHHLLALSQEGPLWESVGADCASALNLKLERFSASLPQLAKVSKFIRAGRPDVIHGWMYHGNLAATWVRRWWAPSAPLIYGIRQSLYDIRTERRLTRAVIRMGARRSSSADAIVYNSHISLEQHTSYGYNSKFSRIIPNGFDTERFSPDAGIREATRARLNLSSDEFVVAIVGRFHPVKDHTTFLRAASLLARSRPSSRFLVVGPGCTKENSELNTLVERYAGGARVELLGSWNDTTTLFPALDALCLTSRAEGFPNVVGEAMSCGVVAVCTDVGETRTIVGDAGFLSAAGDHLSLAAQLNQVATMEAQHRRVLSAAARQRVVDLFAIDRVVEEYAQLYEGLTGQSARAAH